LSKPALNIPVQSGERLELEIETLNSHGDGIARKDGYTVFLPDALPGDRVLAQIVKTTPRFGVARVVERIQAGPDRIDAPCPVFPACGGCRFQHLTYEKQLAFKRQVVADAFSHIAKRDLAVEIQTIAADPVFEYRNKASFALAGRGRYLEIGFYKSGTHEVVDSAVCNTVAGPINAVKEWLRGLMQRHHVSIYDEKKHMGFLRGIVVRHSVATGQTLIGLITTRGVFKKQFLPDLTQAPELKEFGVVGIVQNFNSARTNTILGPKSCPLWGRDYLEDELGGLKFRVSLAAFFQINPGQAEKLYTLIEHWTHGEKGKVVDAYCGNGGISLWLARAGHDVLGIDESKHAIEDAKVSAEWNSIKTCRFLEGTLEGRLKDLESGGPIGTLIVDPPRKGLSKQVIEAIPELNPPRLVYVSCNPATLARDIALLPGYAVRDVRVVDLFPQTQHIECAVLLEKQ